MNNMDMFSNTRSPILSPLLPISEFPDVFDSKPESKVFKSFFQQLESISNVDKIRHQQQILEKLKIKAPILKNIEELKNHYFKSFMTCKKKRKRQYQKKNERWKVQTFIPFVWTIMEYSFLNQIEPESFAKKDWDFIASCFPEINSEQCQYKWETLQKSHIQKEVWTAEEDLILSQILENFKNQKSLKWARIAKELNSRKTENSCIRLGKHCRERWMNNLNPELVKKEWSMEEDEFLLELIAEHGRKWALISKILKGRNEHTIKNRYLSILRHLKRKGKSINANNFQSVLDTFKMQNLEEFGSPTKKMKLSATNLPPIQIPQKTGIVNEDSVVNNTSPQMSNFTSSPLMSPNANGLLDPFPLSIDGSKMSLISQSKPKSQSNLKSPCNLNSKSKDLLTKPIFSLSSFQIPNIYTKCYDLEENYLAASNSNDLNLPIKKFNSYDIERLSQKISSMSITDQILMEANKVLSEMSSINPNIMQSQTVSNSNDKNILQSIAISNSLEKSVKLPKDLSNSTGKSGFVFPLRHDIFTFDDEKETKNNFLVASPKDPYSGYFLPWNKILEVPEEGLKLKTQRTSEEFDVQEKIKNGFLKSQKRKSQTLQEGFLN